MATSQGYKCEFIEFVPEDFYCKKCTLVARRLIFTSCCEETFCYTCIVDSKNQDKPCPVCGEEEFSMVEFKKYQNKVKQLQVYCNMKERGCVWFGILDDLDSHLDPNLDNCQYVDTKCPLNCPQVIPKNKVEQHVVQECAKRPHICQHCGFKATYEEVVDTHLPECKYVALQCPNMCGVSCEREVMEDHMKICRLEEVECEFKGVGCEDRFIREDQEEHVKQNIYKHLTLTASLTVNKHSELCRKLVQLDKTHDEEKQKLREMIKKQNIQIVELKKKLKEQEHNFFEQKNKLRVQELKIGEHENKLRAHETKLQQQDKKLEAQRKKIAEQENKLGEQGKKLEEQESKLVDQEIKLREQNTSLGKVGTTVTEMKEFQVNTVEIHSVRLSLLEQTLQETMDTISHYNKVLSLNTRIVVKNFSMEKAKDKSSDWKSQVMYTHVFGYKFCIGVDANGYKTGRNKSIYVDFWPMSGEFDDNLQWPASAQFTIELINHRGGDNVKCTRSITWERNKAYYTGFTRIPNGFIEHSKLGPFLNNDTLSFYIKAI